MPAVKLTKEIVNSRIMDRGIQQIGEYTTNKTKTEFRCKCGHKWSATPNSIMQGNGCPVCSKKIVTDQKRLSKEIVNERIMDRGIQQIGEYISALTKTEFRCKCGYKWQATPNNIIRGNGCPSCSNRIPLSKDIVNNRLSNEGRGIQQIGEYTNSKTKTEFQCKCGHKWTSIPNNIMCGNGCPKCADYGFQIDKPGWLYILIFANFIKYGITNDLDRRLKDHLKNGQYTIALSKLYEDGSIPQLWERNIKIIFGGRFVTKEIMPDGYTETLSLDKLDDLLNTLP